MSTKTSECQYRQVRVTLDDLFRLVKSAARRGEIRVEGLSPSSRPNLGLDGNPFATTYAECQPFGSSGVSQVVRVRAPIDLIIEGADKVAVPFGSTVPDVSIEWLREDSE